MSKEHPIPFEEIDARAIELFSKVRPIQEWPYVDEADRNYWRKLAVEELTKGER
jgi:hypothetical protein